MSQTKAQLIEGFNINTSAPADALAIDSSGRLLVGTSSARTDLNQGNQTPQVQLEGTSEDTSTFSLIRNSADTGTSGLLFGKSRGTADGAVTVVNSGDTVGSIEFQAADGTDLVRAAHIRCQVDGTPGSNDMPGRLVFSTTADGAASPTERMRIDSSGKVGIGSTTPQGKLHVKTSSSNGYPTAWGDGQLVVSTGETSTSLGIALSVNDSDNSGSLTCLSPNTSWRDLNYRALIHKFFRTDTDESARIDSSGRLLIGTSSSRSVGFAHTLQIEGTNAATSSQSFVRNSNDSSGPQIDFAKTRGTSVGSNTAVQGSDTLGTIKFRAADGTDKASTAAEIRADIDGTPGSNDTPGRLMFSTTADSASSSTERMRIDSSGKVGIGTTSVSQPLHLAGSGGSTIFELQRTDSNTSGTVGAISFTASDGHSVAAINAAGDGDNEGANLVFRTTSAASANSYFTSTTERMRIDSSGNVGIGTTSPGANLHVKSSGATEIKSESTGDNALVSINNSSSVPWILTQRSDTSHGFSFRYNGNNLVNIDTSGRIQAGNNTTKTDVASTVPAVIQTRFSGSFTNYSAIRESGPASFCFGRANGGGSQILSDNDEIGGIRWAGADGTDLVSQAALIQCFVDGTPGSNDMPGRLVFSTTADGGTSSTERMRITSGGRLLVGTTTDYGRIHADEKGMLPDGGGWLSASLVTSGSFGGGISLLDGTKGYTIFCADQGNDFFIRGATSTTANVSGGVKLEDRATSWTSASDEREKENLVSITGAIDKVKTLRTVTGNYTWAPDKDYAFLIAQDVQQVLPEAVSVMNKEAEPEDQRYGIAYTQTIPLLTAALKEAIAKIETLETQQADLLARVTALEE